MREPALGGLDLLDHGVEVREEELAEPPRLLVLGAREAHVDDRRAADRAEQRQLARGTPEEALHPAHAERLEGRGEPREGALGEVEAPLAPDPEAVEEAVELGHQLERPDGLEGLAEDRERQVGMHRELEDIVQDGLPARGHHRPHGGEEELPDDVLVVGGLRPRRDRRQEGQDLADQEERVVGRGGVVEVRRLHGVEEPELAEAVAPGRGPRQRPRERGVVLGRAEEDAPAAVEHLERQGEEEGGLAGARRAAHEDVALQALGREGDGRARGRPAGRG